MNMSVTLKKPLYVLNVTCYSSFRKPIAIGCIDWYPESLQLFRCWIE